MVEEKQYNLKESEIVNFLYNNHNYDAFAEAVLEVKDFLKSKTPIEPNDDAKKIIAKEVGKEFIHHLVRHLVDNKSRCENFADRLLQKLPQPKPFNEAEIRKIVNTYLKHRPTTAECIIKELSTLTPKAQGEVEKGKPSICDEIEIEVSKDE